jgi:methionyl aminopeptidase
MIVRKSKVEIEKMRRAGQVVADVHKELRDVLKPGMSTLDLDRIAEARVRKAGAIDCGATLDGYVGDSAQTLIVGKTTDEIRLLVERTRESLYRGIAQCFPDNRIGDIGHAVESYAKSFGYGVVEDYCGHGVGKRLHEEPQIPNYGIPGTGKRLKSGWTIAIEPMVNLGTKDTIELEDEWTVITADRKASAHWEHSIAITDDGPIILTSRGDDPPGPWARSTFAMV